MSASGVVNFSSSTESARLNLLALVHSDTAPENGIEELTTPFISGEIFQRQQDITQRYRQTLESLSQSFLALYQRVQQTADQDLQVYCENLNDIIGSIFKKRMTWLQESSYPDDINRELACDERLLGSLTREAQEASDRREIQKEELAARISMYVVEAKSLFLVLDTELASLKYTMEMQRQKEIEALARAKTAFGHFFSVQEQLLSQRKEVFEIVAEQERKDRASRIDQREQALLKREELIAERERRLQERDKEAVIQQQEIYSRWEREKRQLLDKHASERKDSIRQQEQLVQKHRAETSRLDESLRKLSMDLNKEKEKGAERSDQLSLLQRQLGDKELKLERLRSHVNQSKSRLSSLQSQLSKAREQRELLQDTVDISRDQISFQSEQVGAIGEQLLQERHENRLKENMFAAIIELTKLVGFLTYLDDKYRFSSSIRIDLQNGVELFNLDIARLHRIIEENFFNYSIKKKKNKFGYLSSCAKALKELKRILDNLENQLSEDDSKNAKTHRMIVQDLIPLVKGIRDFFRPE